MTDMSFMARLISGVKFIVSGRDPEFGDNPASTVDTAPFGPNQPIQPAFQEGMKGRQLDYRTGFNLTYVPRQEEQISFQQLRLLADNYDLVRLAIETRKDQMCKLSWNIQPTDKTKLTEDNPKCKELVDFLKNPDRENNWQTWLRMVLEDLFVIDAPTVYVRRTRGGDVYSLDPMDGALIKRVIDGTGRTPVAPDPAYQQYIKGMPAVDYTVDELIYMPRNRRTWKFYGMSPVEQIITIVNIAIRRQVHQLQYYTEGSTPDLIFQCPPDWNPDQVRHFQELWDSLLAGNTAQRRRGLFVPGGVEPYDVKQNAIKDEYDEWLARVICFCFSLPPTAFVKQMNRATADSQKEQALEEGLLPIMEWVKGLMDRIIQVYFKSPDLEFVWQNVKEVDPKVQAEIDQIYLQNYVISPDEVRARQGLKGPAPEKPAPVAMIGGSDDTDGDDDPKPGAPKTDDKSKSDDKVEKVERSKSKIARINRDRKSVSRFKARMEKEIKSFFADAAIDIAGQVQSGLDKIGRAASDDVQKILDDIDFSGWTTIIDPLQDVLEAVHRDGSAEALIQIGFAPEDSLTNLLNERALTYAEQRAANLVGMKNVGTKENPEWVTNPNAEYAITDSTRNMLRSTVSKAVEEGWSPQKLKNEIKDSAAFNDSRASTIARTELAFADVNGNMDAYRASGVVTGKEWIKGSEHDEDDECDQNADAGVIGLGEAFPSGDDAAPAHPN